MTRRGELLSLSLVAVAPPQVEDVPRGPDLAPWEAPPPVWARLVAEAARAPEGSPERAEAVEAARVVREASERERRE